MAERTPAKESWLARAPAVRDILDATNKVFERFGIDIPSVSFRTTDKLKVEYTQYLMETQAIYRDFEERGLPLASDEASEIGTGILMTTPEGSQIHLASDFFEPIFEESLGPIINQQRLCADSIFIFTTVCQFTLQNAAKEVEATTDHRALQLLKTGTIKVIREMAQELGNPPQIITYVQDLETRLNTNSNLKIVSKGQRVILKDDEMVYVHEFSESDDFALSILEQHLRRLFLRELKKTAWFIPPEKWSPMVKEIYKKRYVQVPKDIGDLDLFLENYLSGELAKGAIALYVENQAKTTETQEKPVESDAEQISQSHVNLNDEHPHPVKAVEAVVEGKKNKKERKRKIYPKQKLRLTKEAEEAELQAKMIKDALAIVDTILMEINQERIKNNQRGTANIRVVRE